MTTPGSTPPGLDSTPGPDSKKPVARAIGPSLAIGAGIGAAVGVASDNVGLWLPVGIAVGLALGVAMAQRGK